MYPALHEEQSSPATSHNVPPLPPEFVAVPEVQVHVLAVHVWEEPAAAGLLIVYPALHEEQSSPATSHNVPPLPPEFVAVPEVQVHVLA